MKRNDKAAPQGPRQRRPLSLLGTAVLAGGLLVMTACRQQMADQPFYKPLEGSTYYKDHAASRELPAGTVSRTQTVNAAYATGKQGDKEVAFAPFPITPELLAKGRDRFNIQCAPCHGLSGDGQGMVAQSFIVKPPTYHQDRLRTVPIGHFVNVMANGFGSMYNYAAKLNPEERWAVAAYIRALQLSQNAKAADLPADQLSKVQGTPQ